MKTVEKSINQPRNWVVKDATKPFDFRYMQYGTPVTLTIHQTAAEETWPGGALWDIGVILSNVLVCLGGFQCYPTNSDHKPPARLLEAFPSGKNLSVLELGCGVGLTGIVASAVLGTQLAVLTDLSVVVDKVTAPNVERNSTAPSWSDSSAAKKLPYRLSTAGKRGRILSMPLCWGNVGDEDAVLECFRQWTKVRKQGRKQLKGGTAAVEAPRKPGQPDLIIIGDVAYQHRPGAPSHFQALQSTLLRFLGPHTLNMFGTRMRMPASSDLLDMFKEDMEEVVVPPIAADEIDPTFASFKHQITVHVLKKKD